MYFTPAAFSVAVLVMTSQLSAAIIFNVGATDSTGLEFANTVSDFTTPFNLAGTENAILGAPDHPGGNNPNVPQIADFGGGDLNSPWAVTVGFASEFSDGMGVDVKIFGVQLNTTEGFELFASGDGAAFTSLGTFSPTSAVNSTFAIEVDFNGAALPADSQFLRFVGTEVPISVSRGFDFDAVGVAHVTATVPEPSTLLLAGVAGTCFWIRRRSQ
jgi:hypothetical protein